MPNAESSKSSEIHPSERDDGDLSDLLSELKVMLPGTQTLTAFLIVLPFNSGFSEIRDSEKVVYLTTFICSVLALILFITPAAQHRLQLPLRDRAGFKRLATRFMVAGMIPLSMALVLATQLVLSEVVATRWVSWAVAGGLAAIILMLWWIAPRWRHAEFENAG